MAKKKELEERKQKEREEKDKRTKEVRLMKQKEERRKRQEVEEKAAKEEKRRHDEHLKRKAEQKLNEEKTNVIDSETIELRKEEAHKLMKAEDFNGAVRILTDLIYFSPTVEHYLKRAECHKMLRKYKLSLKDLNQVESLEPKYTSLLTMKARCYMGLGEFEIARNLINSRPKNLDEEYIFQSDDESDEEDNFYEATELCNKLDMTNT